jgi:hypothetical protein
MELSLEIEERFSIRESSCRDVSLFYFGVLVFM